VCVHVSLTSVTAAPERGERVTKTRWKSMHTRREAGQMRHACGEATPASAAWHVINCVARGPIRLRAWIGDARGPGEGQMKLERAAHGRGGGAAPVRRLAAAEATTHQTAPLQSGVAIIAWNTYARMPSAAAAGLAMCGSACMASGVVVSAGASAPPTEATTHQTAPLQSGEGLEYYWYILGRCADSIEHAYSCVRACAHDVPATGGWGAIGGVATIAASTSAAVVRRPQTGSTIIDQNAFDRSRIPYMHQTH
jgi:hypothetical protein